MFLNEADYPFTQALEANWRSILQEFNNLPKEKFKLWHEKHLYTNDWRVFGLYAFGKRLDKNCALCPDTVEVLKSVPNLVTAGFSCLLPGTHILPHKGYSGSVLRCHLGLTIPPDSALKVAGETRAWREGKCLVFDDTSLHEAWNKSSRERAVLLLDFKKDGSDFSTVEKAKNFFLRFLASRSQNA